MVAKGPALPVVIPYTWGGFYFGPHFGIGQGRGHLDFVGTAPLVETDPHIGGWLAGGQVGYNVQRGRIVYGIEVDASATNINGAQVCGTDPGTDGTGATVRFNPLNQACKNELDWLVTAAARIGMTFWSDRALIYVKGGGAWAREEVSVNCVFGPNSSGNFRHCRTPGNVPTESYSTSHTLGGWMIGWGSEFGLTRKWSAKAEMDYIRFQDKNVTAANGVVLSAGDVRLFVTKVGLNYRFMTR
jgi:opacity protein-like surface antigen